MIDQKMKARVLLGILGHGHKIEIDRLLAGESPLNVLQSVSLVNDVVIGLGRARHIVEECRRLEHQSETLDADTVWRFKINRIALEKLKVGYKENTAAWDQLQDECRHWVIEDRTCILCGKVL